MKPRVVLILLAAVFAVALLVAVTIAAGFLPGENERPDIARDLVAAMDDVGVGGTFRLEEVAPFHWDEIHVFLPYSCGSARGRALGFEWSPGNPLANFIWGVEGVDCPLEDWDEYMLVFVDRVAESVVAWTYTALADRSVLFSVSAESWPSISMPRADACLEVLDIEFVEPRDTVIVKLVECPP